MTSQYVPRDLQRLVRARALDCCEFCQLPQSTQASAFHIDHIWPTSRGGLTELSNLALACVACSLRKAAKVEATDPRTRARVRLFHPREHVWDEHFAWTKSLLVRGRTAIGRATIQALKMNEDSLRDVRRLLAQLGLFPPDHSTD